MSISQRRMLSSRKLPNREMSVQLQKFRWKRFNATTTNTSFSFSRLKRILVYLLKLPVKAIDLAHIKFVQNGLCLGMKVCLCCGMVWEKQDSGTMMMTVAVRFDYR